MQAIAIKEGISWSDRGENYKKRKMKGHPGFAPKHRLNALDGMGLAKNGYLS